MSYRVDTIEHFEREAKKLKKKFPSLKQEITNLVDELEDDPKKGTPIGKGFYKIRLAIRSKGKGKRGGARVITKLKILYKTVYLVSIYENQKNPISGETNWMQYLEIFLNDKSLTIFFTPHLA